MARFELLPHSTVGNFHYGSLDTRPKYFSIEDAVREIKGQLVASWKIPGETAMPEGRYQVVIDFSKRFNRLMPLLLNVPGFDGVRIHIANSDKDVEGCIGIGNTHDKPGWVGDSHTAFGLFWLDLNSWLRQEKVWITVSNPQSSPVP